MNNYSIQFYDLLSRALGVGDSEHVQLFLDDVIAAKYNALQLDGFELAPMQTEVNFTQIQREVGVTPIANYYDRNSPAVPRGEEAVKSWTGTLPRMKDVEYLDEDKIRTQLLLEQRIAAIGVDRVVNGALDTLFNTVDKLVGGHTNALTYQRHQMVSKGKLEITYANNPKGIQGLSISAHVPSGNITTLSGQKRWWTASGYATEGTSANPLGDLRDMVDTAVDAGIANVHFEVERSYFRKVLAHSAVIKSIALSLFPSSSVSDTAAAVAVLSEDVKVRAFESIVGAPVKVIDSIVAVEAPNKNGGLTRSTKKAFEPDVFVLVPDGTIGHVLTSEPIAIQGGTYGTFYDGRLLLTVGVDPVYKCQSFNTEMTSLVVPETPQFMWYLYPNEA